VKPLKQLYVRLGLGLHHQRGPACRWNQFARPYSGFDGQPLNVVGGVISDNVVIMHQSLYGGITLYGVVSGATLVGNSVRGDGSYGLQVSFADSPADETVGDQLVDNDPKDFHAAGADVFLDVNSRNTLVRGECRKVLDLGTGNSVFCHD
jgi:hypothetical protein